MNEGYFSFDVFGAMPVVALRCKRHYGTGLSTAPSCSVASGFIPDYGARSDAAYSLVPEEGMSPKFTRGSTH